MCGIAGILDLGGAPVERRALERLGAPLRHRGPDATGLWLDGPAGFVHHRLVIRAPGPAGDQPMRSADGRFVLAFNGEITNEAELRSDLDRRGLPPPPPSDTALLLALLARDGAACLPRLDGMFAFALLDRETGSLLLARDRMGVKPLYYCRAGDRLLFASEPKALLADPAVPRRLALDMLPHYIAFQAYPAGRTLLDGIRAVEPATARRFSADRPDGDPATYWTEPTEADWDYDEATARVRAAVGESTLAYARERLPLASLLSGGIDSSIVTLLAARDRQAAGDNVATYSSVFPDSCGGTRPGMPSDPASVVRDESAWSALVAAAARTEHHPVRLDLAAMRAMHHAIARILDYPEAGPAVPYLAIQQVVRGTHRVVLTGLGGDELFAGYPKYLAGGRALGLLPETDPAWRLGFERQYAAITGVAVDGPDAVLVKIFSRAKPLVDYLAGPYAEAARAHDAAGFLRGLLPHRELTSVRDLLAIDRKLLLPALLHVEDRVSMAWGLESRPPLLGNAVVDAACRLPARHLFRNGPKGILRDAFRDLLPEAVARRTDKCGLLYPIYQEFGNPAASFLADAYATLDERRIFRLPAAELAARFDDRANRRIAWGLFSLGAWIRTFDIQT